MLSSYRVLDLTDDRGHLCGAILASMGADVIHVEPPGGSPARQMGPFAGPSPDPERSLQHWATTGASAAWCWTSNSQRTGEWASDALLETTLQEGNSDTVTDLLLDLCGALAGALLLVLWTVKSWGSVRRIPAENRFEDRSA